MISNGALDGDMYGVSSFQQVNNLLIDCDDLNGESLYLGKNIYDTTT
jgi:hypothetical protein